MSVVTEFLLRIGPRSPIAFAVALLAALAAIFIQETTAALLGTELYFAAFFPAIVLVSLFAGVPAGTSTTAITIPIVWWEFLPPRFEFSTLTGADYHRFAIFLVLSGLAISACDLYREALGILRQ
jgi:hypothetical protein